jgi:hypothetical protein
MNEIEQFLRENFGFVSYGKNKNYVISKTEFGDFCLAYPDVIDIVSNPWTIARDGVVRSYLGLMVVLIKYFNFDLTYIELGVKLKRLCEENKVDDI